MREEDLKEVADLLVNPNTIELGLKLLEDRFNCRVIRKGDVLEKKDRELRYSFAVLVDEEFEFKTHISVNGPSSTFKMFQFSTIEEKENFHKAISPFINTLVYPTFAAHHANYLNNPNKILR
jgi:hypothetical protein